MKTLVVALVALVVAAPAHSHLVKRMHRNESRAALHAAAQHDYNHSLYVCVRGSGRPKREHCRSLRWLKRVLDETAPPPVVDISPWIPTLDCETGGTMNWYTNTGNGFFGGLQFDHDTWISHGGGAYARDANGATPAQQVMVANRLTYDGWPNCPNP